MQRSTWRIAAVLVLIGASAAHAEERPSGAFLAFEPSTNGAYDFGVVEVGLPAVQVFTLTNTGSRSSSALTLTFVGSAAFTISQDTCSLANLRPGASCTVQLGFSPTAVATESGTLTAAGHRPLVVAALDVSGTAVLRQQRHVYWTNEAFLSGCSGGIGRASSFGADVDDTFIAGLRLPGDVAVDAGHIYWIERAAFPNGAIGRANLDGTGVDRGFITGLFPPTGVAVSAGHIYWSWLDTGAGGIGRARLDGTGANSFFLADLHPQGVAVTSDYVYWTDAEGTISAAALSQLSPHPVVRGLSSPQDLAVDTVYLYWTTLGGTIGRALRDGRLVEENLIPAVSASGVAIDLNHIYWTGFHTVGRADLDGTNVNGSFVAGLNCVGGGVAVDAG